MTDTPAVSAPEEWRIEVDHSSYYDWRPVKENEVADDMVTTDSYWPGFRMERFLVEQPTTTVTTVDVPSLRSGRGGRSDIGSLARHLEDGPWPRHFPMGSITDIRADNPDVEAGLRAYFGVTR